MCLVTGTFYRIHDGYFTDTGQSCMGSVNERRRYTVTDAMTETKQITTKSGACFVGYTVAGYQHCTPFLILWV